MDVLSNDVLGLSRNVYQLCPYNVQYSDDNGNDIAPDNEYEDWLAEQNRLREAIQVNIAD